MNPFDCLFTTFGLLSLWVFWYGFWKDYVVDKFRQDVFALRNDLFLDTVNGKTSFGFDSQEYQRMVNVLNVSIFHVENMTCLRFCMMSALEMIFAPDRQFEALKQEVLPITSETSPDAARYLKDIQFIHGKYTLRFLATISPTCVLFGVFVVFWVLFSTAQDYLNQEITRASEGIVEGMRFQWRKLCTDLGVMNELSVNSGLYRGAVGPLCKLPS